MSKKQILILAIFLLAMPLAVLAHNPRLVKSEETIQIKDPEISQAFYGVLVGEEQWLEINQDKNFTLYVNLLVPKLPNVNRALLFEIYKQENGSQKLIASLDGENFNWSEFYEPFGGDTYLKGPEFKMDAQPGDYLIKVTHCHAGEEETAGEAACAFSKYALVVGQKESFPPGEILNAIYLLPTLKKDFFGKSPWTAYFNYTGLFLLGMLLIFAAIVFFTIWFIKKQKQKKTAVTF